MKKTDKIFWNIWTSYAIYYFGKVNLGIVVPALLANYQNLNLYSVGLVSSGFFFAYALGQFLHGQISERHNPFVYVAVGLIGSAIMNIFLGITGAFFSALFLGEVLDGLFQSMGWSSCVRANALIHKEKDREKYSTILGTSYQIGNSVAWLVSAYAVGTWGWRAGFFVASGFLLARGILLLLTMPKIDIRPPQKVKAQIKNTLSLPIVLAGFALCLLNMVRYGVITWMPLYFFEQGKLTVDDMGKVGLKIFLIPIAGVFGTLLFNKLKTNKDMLAIIYLLLLSFSFVLFPFYHGLMAVGILLIGSFFLYGVHVFLVSTVPTRFADKQIVASSSGFIDGMGYIGTVLIGIIVPFLIGKAGGNWGYVFSFWGATSLATAIFVWGSYYYTKKINN
ncbi:MAG: MFS transporter [Candidatus Omnitrophota bacterium]